MVAQGQVGHWGVGPNSVSRLPASPHPQPRSSFLSTPALRVAPFRGSAGPFDTFPIWHSCSLLWISFSPLLPEVKNNLRDLKRSKQGEAGTEPGTGLSTRIVDDKCVYFHPLPPCPTLPPSFLSSFPPFPLSSSQALCIHVFQPPQAAFRTAVCNYCSMVYNVCGKFISFHTSCKCC